MIQIEVSVTRKQLLFSLAERRLNPNCAVVKWQWVEDAISGFVEFRTSLACFYDELPKPRMFSTFENGKSNGKTFLRTLCIAFSKLMIIPWVVPNLFLSVNSVLVTTGIILADKQLSLKMAALLFESSSHSKTQVHLTYHFSLGRELNVYTCR